MKLLLLSVIACLVLVGCRGDEGGLSAAEREFCSLAGVSEEAALRFDLIFEKGLELELEMDAVNARASGLREGYEAEGMTADEAIAAVSEDLFEVEDFVTACQAAYAAEGGS